MDGMGVSDMDDGWGNWMGGGGYVREVCYQIFRFFFMGQLFFEKLVFFRELKSMQILKYAVVFIVTFLTYLNLRL